MSQEGHQGCCKGDWGGVFGQTGRICYSPGLIQALNQSHQGRGSFQEPGTPDTPNSSGALGRCGALAPPCLEDPIVLRDLL